ncbi:MAG: tetratricopeptide repeat protein [Calditrichaceae bacterium]|nr:tetratricopeptide repeat protein [Calditrichaceae bacterium]MBN2708463.1 tetratricopeptide repeat protein [Calditrichaceae bacterium]RQV93076.1 MAG: tetratricopeptide repeat protein [Calditrichota bacterium]
MKKIIFRFLSILLPFFLLILLEIFLRIINIGEDFCLFEQQGQYWKINKNIGKKYFSQKDISIPEPIEQTFPVNKNNSTLRIVCLGGSTTAGFPFAENINFPYFIKKKLNLRYLKLKSEVINLGMSAIGSTVVLDFVRQLKTIKPDLVLIYMGHNEFYGALGTASTEYITQNQFFLKIVLWVRTLRFYQLLRNISLQDSHQGDGQVLMPALIGKHILPINGKTYNKTHEIFENNLIEIIKILQDNKIPVLISTVTSNLRDQVPLERLSGIVTDSCDENSAYYNYKEAGNLLKDNLFEKAKLNFILAKDLDQIRFRAASDINRIIKETCLKFKIPFVDTEQKFNTHSFVGVPGNELFLEHLHPNEKGYQLIAQSFLDSIYIFIAKNKFNLADSLSLMEIHYSKLYSTLDILIGEIKIRNLLRYFPFNNKVQLNFSACHDPYIFTLAMEKVERRMYWDEAHYRLGDYFLNKNNFSLAEAEYRIVLEAYPDFPEPYYKIALIYEKQSKWELAYSYYKKALVLNPNLAFIYAKIGIIDLSLKRYNEAISIFKKLINSRELFNQISASGKAEIYYLLSVAYLSVKENKLAKNTLSEVFRINPNHIKANQLKKYVEK